MRQHDRRWALLLGSGLALAACTASAGPPAGSQFDGTYAGQDTLVIGVAFQCGLATLPETIVVRGGEFDYPFQVNPPRTAPLPVQVFADGTVHGQMQYGTEEPGPRTRYILDWVRLNGRISGTTLDATITNLRCTRHLTAQRSDTANPLGRQVP